MDLAQIRSSSKNGSVFIEAAIVFPLVIAVIALVITTSFKLYTVVKENSIEHKSHVQTNYETYEKGRLLISIYSADSLFSDAVFLSDNWSES